MGPMTEKKRPYTRFYHDIEDALISAKLNGTQLALVLFIQRKTFGWGEEKGKSGECISLTEFSRETGYHRTNIHSELKNLKAAKIIICAQASKRALNTPATWKLNDKPDTWKLGVLVNRLTVSDKKTVSEDTTPTVSEKANTPVSLEANPSLKKEEKKHLKKEEPATADSRFQPLVNFFHETFEETRGVKLGSNGSDYSTLKAALKSRPDLELQYLKDSARMFLESKKDFYREQGNPLRYWASHINGFVPGRSNGSGEWGGVSDQEYRFNPIEYDILPSGKGSRWGRKE